VGWLAYEEDGVRLFNKLSSAIVIETDEEVAGKSTARFARSRAYASASSRKSKAATGSSRSCCNHLFLRRVASLTPFASDTAP
jgi:hypothetical protein